MLVQCMAREIQMPSEVVSGKLFVSLGILHSWGGWDAGSSKRARTLSLLFLYCKGGSLVGALSPFWVDMSAGGD